MLPVWRITWVNGLFCQVAGLIAVTAFIAIKGPWLQAEMQRSFGLLNPNKIVPIPRKTPEPNVILRGQGGQYPRQVSYYPLSIARAGCSSLQIAVTGAASGMGLATAKLLASRGAAIALADINEAAVKSAKESLSGNDRHMCSLVDVRSSQSVNAWIKSVVERLGKLDGAVNMAGIITTATPVAEETDENWEFNFAVNTRGVFFCIRAELNAMKAGGSIVSFLPLKNTRIPGLLPRATAESMASTRFLQPVSLDKWAPLASLHTVPARQLLLG